MRPAKRMALSGVLCALAAAVMLLGGLIPLATFCCPAIAAMLLLPVFVECGERMAWAAWAAVALISLIVCPDKEAALLFAFVGYYPILRWRLEQIRRPWLRRLAKAGAFNLPVVAMYALSIFVLRLEQLLRDARALGLWLSLACLLAGNLCFALYDRLTGIAARMYAQRFRKHLR